MYQERAPGPNTTWHPEPRQSTHFTRSPTGAGAGSGVAAVALPESTVAIPPIVSKRTTR